MPGERTYEKLRRRLDRHAAKPTPPPRPPKVKQPSRFRLAMYYGTQNVAHRIVRMTEDGYADTICPDLLSEDDRGDLHGPAKREGWWEPFKPWVFRHLRAALTSRRTGLVNMVEFDSEEPSHD